jgi:hypothetical protein
MPPSKVGRSRRLNRSAANRRRRRACRASTSTWGAFYEGYGSVVVRRGVTAVSARSLFMILPNLGARTGNGDIR